MDSKLEGFAPSWRIIFIPSIKNITIKSPGNASAQTTAAINRALKTPMIQPWDTSRSEYWANRKNTKNIRHTSTARNETPLHSVRGSRTIIPINDKKDIKNNTKEIRHIPSSLLTMYLENITAGQGICCPAGYFGGLQFVDRRGNRHAAYVFRRGMNCCNGSNEAKHNNNNQQSHRHIPLRSKIPGKKIYPQKTVE